MTIPQIQKKAQAIGLPKVKTKLCILFGYTPRYLAGIEAKGQKIPQHFLNTLALYEEIYELKKKLKDK